LPLLLAMCVALAAVLSGPATAAAPSAITGPVSATGATSATVNGTVNPGGVATTWHFEYGTSTSYGSQTPSVSAGSGSANVDAKTTITGLSGNTTYHYRLVATSSAGTSRGTDGVFTTERAPGVSSGSASALKLDGATVNGSVTPYGLDTSWYVEYGTSTGYGSKTAAKSAGAGGGPIAVSVSISGLKPATDYHYRVVASNAAGTTTGQDVVFRTLSPPTALTGVASSIGSTSATLNGVADPNARSSSWWFEYGKTTALGSRTSTKNIAAGTKSVAVSAKISGLSTGTTYYFRLVVKNDLATVTGKSRSFVAGVAPTVVTGPVISATSSTATATGTVNPNGRATSYYVEFGTTTKYGSRSATQSAGSGTNALSVAAPLTGLKPGTLYHARLVASSSAGTSYGADVVFQTGALPAVATGPLASVGVSAATLTGIVNPAGRDATFWFEYGRSRSYGFRTPARAVAASTADQRVSEAIAGLTPGVRYHYRLVAASSAGTTVGADASFSLAPLPRDSAGRPIACTIVGTAGPDVLRGTPGRDVICGLGGNDRITGGGGADVIYAGPGDDIVHGGPGNDTISGGAGADELYGDAGDDRVSGDAGSDRLFGGAGADTLLGLAGNDVLLGGIGRDRLLGGVGNDVIFARDGRRDIVDGGPGRDRATLDRSLDVASRV
jgi:Ca2+-binding RTX toxin-like protein